MNNLPEDDGWPHYLPGPKNHLVALGAITLSYGYLESLFQFLFGEVAKMTLEQVNAIFYRLPNTNRVNMMRELLTASTLPTNIKELTSDFLKAFELCVEARNGLMHARSGGVVHGRCRDEQGFVFTKTTKAGKHLRCAPSLSDLRAVADSMEANALFAVKLASAINRARVLNLPKESTWFPSPPEKLLLPPPLNWEEETNFQAHLPPHGPFLL
jgi:hypothetical protein